MQKGTAMPRFSIITPVYLWGPERVEKFLKCIKSVKKQTFRDFEWVVVNDGSIVDFLWDKLLDGFSLNLIHKDHNERVLAYNDAFQVAKGDWFVFLDSDDELIPDALNKLAFIIKENPRYKMFNFGVIYKHKDGGEAKRAPFQPKMLKVGHEIFGGGNIVNGSFIFHRSVWEKLGGFGEKELDETGHIRNIDCTSINYPNHPDQKIPFVRDLYLGNPWDFSAWAQLRFPEIQQFYMVKHPDHPKLIPKDLGNPWGNDYLIYYKYTRKYHCLPVDEYLYKINVR